jgi:hypothetical protein
MKTISMGVMFLGWVEAMFALIKLRLLTQLIIISQLKLYVYGETYV